MEATKFIEGKRVEEFVTPDPTPTELSEFEKLEASSKWQPLRDHFMKFASLNREAMWEGKADVTAFTEWWSAVLHFFTTPPVLNSVAQTALATFAFRGVAREWWSSKLLLYPRLVVTFD